MSHPSPWQSDAARVRKFWLITLLVHGLLVTGMGLGVRFGVKKPLTLEVVLAESTRDDKPQNSPLMADRNESGGKDADKTRQQSVYISPLQLKEARDNPVLQKGGRLSALLSPPLHDSLEQSFDPEEDDHLISASFSQEVQNELRLPNRLIAHASLFANNAKQDAALASRRVRVGPYEVEEFAKDPSDTALPKAFRKEEAKYVYEWIRKVEQTGNAHYPSDPKTHRALSGAVVLAVDVQPEGEVSFVRILESSGNGFLDEQAVRIVQMAAPFKPFDESMKARLTHLRITKPWNFYGGGFD